MAYYNFFCMPPNRNAFIRFDGRFNQVPIGIINPPPARFLPPEGMIDPLYPRFIGDELPSVDPFNYPGVVHFGPSFTILGPHPPNIPPGTGVYDPNLVVPGAASFSFAI